MFQSIRSSHIALRVGLALVFGWFGINAFVMSQSGGLSILLGIIELGVALSFATGFFVRLFSVIGAMLLVGLFAANTVRAVDALVQTIGLLGGLVALMLWPERTYI